MKLIIDIPEEYKVLFDKERCKSKFDSLATNEFGYVLRKAFENGTPLDDVKTEIEHMACRQYEHRLTLDRQEVIDMLDNIDKELFRLLTT